MMIMTGQAEVWFFNLVRRSFFCFSLVTPTVRYNIDGVLHSVFLFAFLLNYIGENLDWCIQPFS